MFVHSLYLASGRGVTANPNEMWLSIQLWDKGVWIKPKRFNECNTKHPPLG